MKSKIGDTHGDLRKAKEQSIAMNDNFCHKRQSRTSLRLVTAFNQNVLEVRMTGYQYSSIIWLSQDRYTIIDNEDYKWLSQWKWHITHSGYALRRTPRINGVQGRVYMHRLLNNTALGFQTDHIDGNPLNNRRNNLRECTQKQNTWNARKPNHNTSGFKGVTFHTPTKKWFARIMTDGHRVHLGTFDTIEEARDAYQKSVTNYHGEFARCN